MSHQTVRTVSGGGGGGESEGEKEIVEKEEGTKVKGEPPLDRGNLVFIICAWLGIALLLPWNFYYNANAYWMFKFRDLDLPLNKSEHQLNSMQTFWNSSLSLVSMAPNFFFLFLNVLIGHRFSIQPRLYLTLSCNIVLFILSLVFTQVTTDPWQNTFYWITLAFAMLFNINDSIFQGAFASYLGRLPMKYMSSLANGQAIGGTLASLTSVAFLAIGGGAVNVALFSFSLAAIFLTSAVILLYYASRQPFYRYYLPDDGIKTNNEDKAEPGDLGKMMSRCWMYFLSVFLTFLVTLSVFPSLFALTVSLEDEGTVWAEYYIPVGGFLLFNVGDLLGRIIAGFLRWPRPTRFGAQLTLLCSILRVVFIPLFMFCNTNPTNRVNSKVLFHSDAVFMIINAVFSLSNGYICNVCMMCAPKMLEEPRLQSRAASFTVFLLVAGLLAGSGFSFLWVQLL